MDPSQIQELQTSDLFQSVGRNCEVLDSVCNNLRAVVVELRRRGVTLNDRPHFDQAVQWIAAGYQQAPGPDVLKRYARTLNNFLCMPTSKLPSKPILTGSYPRWYGKGDEVAVYDRGEWWHAVVIGDVKPKARKVHIFWVGYAEHETGNERILNAQDSLYQNPCYVGTEGIRSLSEMASPKAGSLADYGVAWIQEKYCGIATDAQESEGTSKPKPKPKPRRRPKRNPIRDRSKPTPRRQKPDSGRDDDADDDCDVEADVQGTGPSQASSSSPSGSSLSSSVSDNDGEEEAAESGDVGVEERSGPLVNHIEDDDDDIYGARAGGDDDDGSGTGDSQSSSSSASESASSSSVSDGETATDSESDDDGSKGETSPPNSGPTDPRFYFDLFNLPNFVEDAIETLIALDSGLAPHTTLFHDMSTKLTKLASFLARMYGNDSYKTLVSGTLEELQQYQGKEVPKLPHSQVFLKGLLKHGFCITPRMWMKEEIVCFCISLLDPRLDFTGIRQKDGVNSDHSFRGMAGLDSRVQTIFYRRLRSYGFVNPRWHPEKLQSFSSVVINGGGSWKQAADWKFNEQFRFVVDASAKPFMIRIHPTASGALEAGGVYVASTTKKNGKPIYIQVSKKEYDGFVGQKSFRDCIKEECRQSVKEFLLCNKGSRIDACSPRVLVCCNQEGTDWGIQLLPGFGSDFYMFKFAWSGQSQSVENAQCFTNVDFETFTAEMQPCSLSISILHGESCLRSGESARHVFSFGTLKSVIPAVDKDKMKPGYKPQPLPAQGFHSDGPTVHNARNFDMLGRVRLDAPASYERRKGCWFASSYNALSPYLGDHISIMQESFSALFGMFKGTFIETPISDEAARNTRALRVDIPLGTAIVFTFAWKHRGKGDNPDHVVTSQSPVEVHARPHFYVYGRDLRKLPTVDLEATLEFLSICSQNHNNRASQLQVLDCLQTFEPVTALGHWDAAEVHERFNTQQDLETYIASQLSQQRSRKMNAVSVDTQQCKQWFLYLTRKESAIQLQLQWDDPPSSSVVVTSACFDSKQPSFRDSQGKLYILSGEPVSQKTFPANTIDSTKFRSDFDEYLLPSANQATADLQTQWDENHLLHLCYILNTLAMTECTLTYNTQELRAKGKYVDGSTQNLRSLIKDDRGDRVLVTASACILIIGDFAVNDKRKQPIPKACSDLSAKDDAAQHKSTPLKQRSETASRRSIRLSSGPASTPKSRRSSSPKRTGILPAIARCKFPSEVHEDEIVWEQWEDCNVRGVGNCNVWNVHARKRSFDSIAIRVAGTEEIFRLNGVTTRYDARTNTVICKEVRPPKQRCQYVYFENVCRSFGAWALPKGQKPDFSAQHEAFFVSSNLLLVECGGNGDCFYHSCLFLLKMYKNVQQDTTHGGLRTATVLHLKTHYESIMAPDPELNGDGGMPVYCLLPGASLSEASNATDEALVHLVKNYCDTHGELREYVEDPIIHVFAHLMNITIVVYHTTAEDPITFNDSAGQNESSVMALWFNGGHYMVRYRPPKT